MPGSYCIMSGKSKELYIDLFNRIKDAANELNLTLKPECIMIDFEKGITAAIQRHFTKIKISGCHFHFCSTVYKKIFNIGLKEKYNTHQNFRKWLRQFMCFPFLPLNEIDRCRNILLEK